MKLHTVETPVQSSGSLNISTFKIATSAKAFKILSSNLYSNKIRAIIREISCNAADAHKMIGNEQPFQVSLPSRLNEQFVVRDFGPGLSHDDVMELYTTYFASTKSDSNDYTGALGLGSKSPFAYCDTFGVTSWHQGVARTYSVFLKDGEPSITLVFEQASDEPSGLEVSVPVEPDNIGTFRNEASYVYTCFSSAVETSARTYSAEVIESGDNWKIGKWHPYYDSTVYAIMGNVIYPLDKKYMSEYLLKYISSTYMFINFEIGELDVTPSREELSYDDDTVANIRTKVAGIEAELKDKFSNLVKGLSLRDQYQVLSKMTTHLDLDTRGVFRHTIGADVGSWLDSLVVDATDEYQVKITSGLKKGQVETLRIPVPIDIYNHSWRGFSKSTNKSTAFRVSPKQTEFHYLLNDLGGKPGIRRVVDIMISNFDGARPVQVQTFLVIDSSSPQEMGLLNRIKATFEPSVCFEYSATSILAQDKASKGPTIRKKNTFIEVANQDGITTKFANWAEFIQTASGLVFTKSRSDIHSVVDDIPLCTRDYRDWISKVDSTIAKDMKIWYAPREQRERIERHIKNGSTNLRCLGEFIASSVKDLGNDPVKFDQFEYLVTNSVKTIGEVVKSFEAKAYCYDGRYRSHVHQLRIEIESRIKDSLPQNKVVDDSVQTLYNFIKGNSQCRSVPEILRLVQLIHAWEIQAKDNIERVNKRFLRTYPLVGTWLLSTNHSRYQNNTDLLQDLITYMENVDHGYSV